jgi:hypothetical protein
MAAAKREKSSKLNNFLSHISQSNSARKKQDDRKERELRRKEGIEWIL